MLAATKEWSLDLSLLRLLAHEYFHRWNGNLISLRGNEQENAWLGEGFTDYYTYKLLYRLGLITQPEYVKSMNKIIADYYLSPHRNEPKDSLGKYFWSTRDYNNLPYNKGAVYALYLDHLITKSSSGLYSLDGLLFELAKLARAHQPITDSVFISLANRFTRVDIHNSHYAYINEGKLKPVDSSGLVAGMHLQQKTFGAFDLGFDLEQSWKAKKVIAVKPNSDAEKAGLREGQALKTYSIHYYEIDKPVAITIEENGIEKIISYLPMAAQKISVPQFYLK